MKMKKKTYWQRRSEDRLLDLLSSADSVVLELGRYYDKASKDIDKSIRSLYGRFMSDNDLDKNKALELIKGKEFRDWRMTMEEYLSQIKATDDKALLLELNTLAMRSRINRLEALQAEIMANCAIIASKEEKVIGSFLSDSIEDTYYKNVYDEYKDENPEALELMNKHKVAISRNQVKKVLELPWSGANYSQNIWNNSYFIAKRAQSMVAKNIIAGRSIENLSRDFAKVYGKQYYSNVKRLLRTETAYVKGQADVLTYEKLKVEEYELLATLDNRTSSICQEKDGKHYPVDEIQVGINYPPFHPNCRTTTMKYREDYGDRTRIAKDKDGKNVKVPLGMKYDEWYEKYIKNGEKGYNISKKQNEEIRSAKEIVKGLPDISEIKTDEDIKKFAEKVIENMGIDASKIDIDIEEIDGASGYCGVSDDATENILHYSEYRLAKNDNRPMKYRIKTAFHEAVHLSANGLTWDGLVNDEVSDSWIMMEETFTESAANYLCSKYGIESKLVPSYPDLLGKILPKLKQVEKYSKCKTIDDFGEIALRDRMNGVGPNWKKLSEEISKKDIPKDYYTQYYDYIEDNKEELVNRFFESSKLPASYRKKVENDLEWAMKSDFDKLPFGHRHIFFSVITCAMKEMGVK